MESEEHVVIPDVFPVLTVLSFPIGTEFHEVLHVELLTLGLSVPFFVVLLIASEVKLRYVTRWHFLIRLFIGRHEQETRSNSMESQQLKICEPFIVGTM